MTPAELAPFFGAFAARVMTRLPTQRVSFEPDLEPGSVRASIGGFSGTFVRINDAAFREQTVGLEAFGTQTADVGCDQFLRTYGPITAGSAARAFSPDPKADP